MFRAFLDKEQEEIRSQTRSCLTDLLTALAECGAEESEQKIVKESLLALEQMFLIVVVGEFNAGKSALINALIGERVLPEGVTPTTKRIHLVQHGESARKLEGPGFEVISHPAELLNELTIVDTPGTNAIQRDHEKLTSEFVPRSDLVLFATSADRPFTESERAFLQSIREWGKKIVVVINKIDILDSDSDLNQVVSFVRENLISLLGFEAQIFPISAKRAEKSRTSGKPMDLGFNQFEAYLLEQLSREEKIRLKLLNPLGVALKLGEEHLNIVSQNQTLIRSDLEFLSRIDSEHQSHAKQLETDFQLRLADIDNLLFQFEKRGIDFFEEQIRLARVFELLNREKIQQLYERRVVGDMPQQIDDRVTELIDWLVSSDLNRWQSVMQQLNRQKSAISQRVIGDVGQNFRYDRARLIEGVGQKARRTLESYDPRSESKMLASRLQAAVTGTALTEIGAVSLGAAVSMLATSTAVDVTGMITAGTIAVLGLLVIPNRRRKARKELEERIVQMRRSLNDILTQQFQREIRSSRERVENALAPYSSFVRSERERFDQLEQKLSSIRERADLLRARVEG